MLEVPTNPCEGCKHRELGPVAHNPRTHRDALTTICLLRPGTLYRVWWGDELPSWCPVKTPRKPQQIGLACPRIDERAENVAGQGAG